MLKATHPMGLKGALWMDLFKCVCVWEGRILSSQQPDVCKAIPLHNYLRTSGTYKHSQPAPALSLCLCLALSSSSSSSLLSHFLPLCPQGFFYPPSLSLSLPRPPYVLTNINFDISTSSAVHAQSIHSHPLFLTQLVATLLSLPHLPSPCLHGVVLLPLVTPFDSCQNITSSRSADNSVGAYLLFRFLSFFGDGYCLLVCTRIVYSQHKSSCKSLCITWTELGKLPE